MIEQKKIEQTFINEYMAWSLHDRDVKRQAVASFVLDLIKALDKKDSKSE